MLWLQRWPRTCATLLLAAGFVTLGRTAPSRVHEWFAKEGAVESGSHVVLALAIVGWMWSGARRGRRWALGMALYLALVLGEELDWGAVLEMPAIGVRLDALVGHRNFHNMARGSSYLLFSVPLLLYFAAPARMHGALAPLRDERATFFAIAGLFVLFNLGPWEREAQEGLELVLYALLLACGLRLARG